MAKWLDDHDKPTNHTTHTDALPLPVEDRVLLAGRTITADGCTIAPSCLVCPLPRCRFELPPKAALRFLNEQRFTELREQGLTLDEISAVMGISRRGVFRYQRSIADARAGRPAHYL